MDTITKRSKGWRPVHKSLPYPGLTDASSEIPVLVTDVAKRRAALHYKKMQTCTWVVFFGGTGTGKSTLFNAFCRRPISETGVERPKTSGPILYTYEDCAVVSEFPFEHMVVEELTKGRSIDRPSQGLSDKLLLLTHTDKTLQSLVVVDTPDLDSVEQIHRQIAEDFYLLADAVIFVASQEKYADEMTCQFLAKVIEENRPVYFLLNKAQPPLAVEEIVELMNHQGISLSPAHLWFISYEGADSTTKIAHQRSFQAFVDTLLDEITGDGAEAFKQAQIVQRTDDLRTRTAKLESLIENELDAASQWQDQLSKLCSKASVALLESEKQRFLNESSGYIQREVKKLFYRYDVLAKPRQFVRSILRAPLEVLGVLKGTTHTGQKEALSKVRGKIVFTTILRAVDHFNRNVLDLLSPKDPSSPLYGELRQSHVTMTEDEIRATILKEQDLLDRWLEDRFAKLAHDLPRRKKWGIYSTSILWGVLILSFEVIVGGGFTVLDAALDSIIAPFVTKGTVELFASREIRKVARELAQRYEKGILSVIIQQKEKYENCLTALLPPEEALDGLGQRT